MTSDLKSYAISALDAATRTGVTYADVRVIKNHDRNLSTKNGRTGHVSSSESQGLGIRVIVNGRDSGHRHRTRRRPRQVGDLRVPDR